MKKLSIISLLLLFAIRVFAQSLTPVTVDEVITAVKKAQASIKNVSYTAQRIDTLLTSDTRTFSGKVLIQVIPQDTIYGFHFFSKQDDDNSEQVYDGHIAYLTDQDKKQYQMSMTLSGFLHLTGTGGGRLLMPDLIKLDTSKASNITLKQDEKYYYLVINRPDLTQYDIINRRKTVTIDKSNMLPVAVRDHQENYGKTQDLYYHITSLKINQPPYYSFSSPPFLKEYTQFVPAKTNDPMLSLVNQLAPAFTLTSFDGKTVMSEDFKGKIILLDFWEVWCAPCIESMPKVEKLYDKYKNRDFLIYGIINDLKQLQAAKNLVKSKGIQFPILSGNAKLKIDYKFDGGVPMYVLIDKTGRVSWINRGYPGDMEELIIRALE